MINRIKLKKFNRISVISIASLALVIPLTLASINTKPVHADSANSGLIISPVHHRAVHYTNRRVRHAGRRHYYRRKPARQYHSSYNRRQKRARRHIGRTNYNNIMSPRHNRRRSYYHVRHQRSTKHSRRSYIRHKKIRRTKRSYKNYRGRVPQFEYRWTTHTAPITDHTETTDNYHIGIKPVKNTRSAIKAINDFNTHKKAVAKAMINDPDTNSSPLTYLPINDSLYGFEQTTASTYGSSPQAPIDVGSTNPEYSNQYYIFETNKNIPNARKVLENQAKANKPSFKGYLALHFFADLTNEGWEDQSRNSIYGDIRLDRRDNGVGDISRDPELDRIAEERAHQICDNFSHTDSNGNIIFLEDASQRGDDYSSGWGENIATNSGLKYYTTDDVGDQFNKQWYTDEKGATPDQDGGHRKNILNPDFNYVGVGVYKNGDNFYACEDFSN